MKISIYSTAFNIEGKGFDYKDALNNWFCYADEVCIAINNSHDNTESIIRKYAEEKNFNLKIISTNIPYEDSFCYGKIENSALQACTGDILFQQNLDERIGGNKDQLIFLANELLNQDQFASFFVPVINLHGDYDHYHDFIAKWYIHKKGFFRGAVNFALKDDGKPDFNKTSTDELIDGNGNLLPTYPLCQTRDENILLDYCKSGNPFVYHLGYVDLDERIERNKFWKPFWENATGGDENEYHLEKNIYINRVRKKHNLNFWKK